MFCAGVSELHASSQYACSENGSISMISGWSLGPSDVKRSSTGHLQSQLDVGHLDPFDRSKTSSMFLKNDSVITVEAHTSEVLSLGAVN